MPSGIDSRIWISDATESRRVAKPVIDKSRIGLPIWHLRRLHSEIPFLYWDLAAIRITYCGLITRCRGSPARPRLQSCGPSYRSKCPGSG